MTPVSFGSFQPSQAVIERGFQAAQRLSQQNIGGSGDYASQKQMGQIFLAQLHATQALQQSVDALAGKLDRLA